MLLPGELCCCQENDLQRDGKNAEVLFCLHKQLTSELFLLPSDKVSVRHDRDEPASVEIIFAAEGETRGAALRGSSGGRVGKHPLRPNGYGNSFPPQRMGRIILQKITVWKMHAGGPLLSKT